jgi:hypothetical protein
MICGGTLPHCEAAQLSPASPLIHPSPVACEIARAAPLVSLGAAKGIAGALVTASSPDETTHPAWGLTLNWRGWQKVGERLRWYKWRRKRR